MTDKPHLTPAETQRIRATQLGRARILAWLLGAFVVIVFAASIVKMGIGRG